jgi:uncharacterized protein YggU (UPF0235/DUF167 family)
MGAMASPSCIISVRLTPRAARERMAAAADGTFVAHVTAPPVDGRANEALCRLVARAAGVAPSHVTVLRGHRGRRKAVRVDGVEERAVRARLAGTQPPT